MFKASHKCAYSITFILTFVGRSNHRAICSSGNALHKVVSKGSQNSLDQIDQYCNFVLVLSEYNSRTCQRLAANALYKNVEAYIYINVGLALWSLTSPFLFPADNLCESCVVNKTRTSKRHEYK